MDGGEYLERAKREPWVIIQIEHIDAVANLEDILAVEGIDTVVIGSSDLSGSMGLLTQLRHPDVIEVCDQIAATCRKADIPFGVSLLWSEENVRDWIKRGVAWIGVDNDVRYLSSGARTAYEATRRLLAELR